MTQPLATSCLTDRERRAIRQHEYGELDPLRSVDDRIEVLSKAAEQLREQVSLHEALLNLVLEAVAERLGVLV